MAQVTIIPAKDRSDEIVRTAAYARVSSDSQDQLNSFAAQIRYYTEMLQNSNNAVFVDMYADEGITGTSATKREDFQRLMNDCRKGKIDRILTKSVSRFARNTKDCLEAIRELKTLGVSVYFEKENIDTSELSSEMLLTLHSQFAQEESMSISKNVRMGIHKRMADGSYNNLSVPYGFAYHNGEIIIDEEKAKIVKQIFDWYHDGIGYEEIAFRLNKMKIPPVNGKCWRTNRVVYILQNEKYVGDSLLQKSITTDTLPFQRLTNNGEMPKYYISNTHRPIIDRKVFDDVQELMKTKSTADVPIPKKYVFSQKIKCGCCGGTYRRKICHEKTYWVCRNHDHKGIVPCGQKQILEELFKNAFITLCVKLSGNYREILIPALHQLQRLRDRGKAENEQLAALRKEISDINQQKHLIAKLKTQGVLDSAYYADRAQSLDSKLVTLQKQIRSMLDSEGDNRLSELRRLISAIEEFEPSTSFSEEMFERIVDRIIVKSDTELRFELLGGISFSEQINRKR